MTFTSIMLSPFLVMVRILKTISRFLIASVTCVKALVLWKSYAVSETRCQLCGCSIVVAGFVEVEPPKLVEQAGSVNVVRQWLRAICEMTPIHSLQLLLQVVVAVNFRIVGLLIADVGTFYQ